MRVKNETDLVAIDNSAGRFGITAGKPGPGDQTRQTRLPPGAQQATFNPACFVTARRTQCYLVCSG